MRDVGTKSIPLPALALPPRKDSQLEEGQRIGRYQLLVPLARGGMAEVWIARLLGDLGFSRIFALKTIRSEYASNAAFRNFFFEEARIAARLRHVNVVEVVDLGEEGPILFQVMTLIEGESLASILRAHVARIREGGQVCGLPYGIAARILCDALTGLHAAHELTNDDGVPLELVHRDVSPQNVLVGLDGVAKLSDFGIAKVLGGVIEDQSGLVGKPGYLSPEQANRKPIDRRSDIFTAGIVLWENLTGLRLFKTDNAKKAALSSTDAEIPNPRVFVPWLSEGVADVVMQALAKDPGQRFQTAADMRDALEASARAQGGLATSTDVARFVEELCGESIREIQESVRRVVRGEASTDLVPERRTELMTISAIALDGILPKGGTQIVKTAVRQYSVASELREEERAAIGMGDFWKPAVALVLATLAVIIATAVARRSEMTIEPLEQTETHAEVTEVEGAPSEGTLIDPLIRAGDPAAQHPLGTNLAPAAADDHAGAEEAHAPSPEPSAPHEGVAAGTEPDTQEKEPHPSLTENVARKQRPPRARVVPRPKFTNPYAR